MASDEYISKQKVREILDDLAAYYDREMHEPMIANGIGTARAKLDDIPTANVEPVVRCGECKYQNTKNCLMAAKSKVIGYNHDQPFYTTIPSDLWYCFAGKRKENKNEK